MIGVADVCVTAGISAAMSAATGLVVKLAIERKYVQAAAAAEENRRRRVRFTELRSAWMWAAGRVLYHLVRIAQGVKRANGDLEDSYRRLDKIECELKEMERNYAAEAQLDRRQ